MAYPKDLRAQLGITQEAFATMTGCTAGQLAMAETGKRSLPNKSIATVHELDDAATKANQTPLLLPPLAPATTKWLRKQARQAQANRQLLQLKQESLEMQLQQVLYWLKTASLLDGNPHFANGGITGMQFRLLKRKAVQKQQAMQLKLAKLSLQLAAAESAVQAVALLEGSLKR